MTPDQDREETTPQDEAGGTGQMERLDRVLDEALKDTFPASDPISLTPPSAPRSKRSG